MADIKTLRAYAKKLLEAGMSVAEMRRAVDQHEAELDAEAASVAPRCPSGLTRQQRAAIDLDRAHAGLPPMLPPLDDPGGQVDQRRDLSGTRLAARNMERAFAGLPDLTSDEIIEENLRRAAGLDRAVSYAPKEWNKLPRQALEIRLAKANLERASRGEPELLPHPDDSDGDE